MTTEMTAADRIDHLQAEIDERDERIAALEAENARLAGLLWGTVSETMEDGPAAEPPKPTTRARQAWHGLTPVQRRVVVAARESNGGRVDARCNRTYGVLSERGLLYFDHRAKRAVLTDIGNEAARIATEEPTTP